jgi:hypothetical protein
VAVLAEGFGDDSLAEHDKCRKSGQNDQCGANQVPGISKDLTHRQGCQQYNYQTVLYSKIARFLVVNFNRGGFGGAGELGEITQGGGKREYLEQFGRRYEGAAHSAGGRIL